MQQRIVGKIDPGDKVRGTERDLFGLGEKIIRPAIQHHPANDFQRNQFLGYQFGRIQVIERKSVRLLLGEQLHREFPLRKIAGLDRFEQIPPMKIGIGADYLHRLVPDRGLKAELRPPMEFDEGRIASGIEQSETVDAETFDHPQ